MAKYSQKVMGKEVGQARTYAPPHDMAGKPVSMGDIGLPVNMPKRKNWTPLNGGVSIGNNDDVKTSGVKMRGAGAAIKGVMSRGPMA